MKNEPTPLMPFPELVAWLRLEAEDWEKMARHFGAKEDAEDMRRAANFRAAADRLEALAKLAEEIEMVPTQVLVLNTMLRSEWFAARERLLK